MGEVRTYSRLRQAAAAVTCLSAATVFAVNWFYVCTLTGRHLDSIALSSAALGRGHFLDTANRVLAGVSVAAVVVAIGCVAIAIGRRRFRVAVASVLIVAGANATTQLLKAEIMTRPRLGFEDYFPVSLPSGHVTMAASISMATLIAVPVAWRWWIGLVGIFMTSLVGWSTMVSGWHRPSDMVAGVLVALAWAALAVAVGGRWVVAPSEVQRTGLSLRLSFAAGATTAARLRWVFWLLVALAAVGILLSGATQLVLLPGIFAGDYSQVSYVGYLGSIAGYLSVVCGALVALIALLEWSNVRPRPRNVPSLPSSG